MNIKILATIVILTSGLAVPVRAQEEPATEVPEKTNPVATACLQNQAETLPNPFSDVPPNHWAFKAVMTMYYCGAFRQATPPALFQQLQSTENQQQLLEKPQSQNQRVKSRG